MERVTGLEHLTMLDTAPPEFVSLAAKAGFDSVSLRIAPVTDGEDAWPVSPGSPMLTETLHRCSDTGVTVLGAEAIAIGSKSDLTGCESVIETAAALGARYLNIICDDQDTNRFAEKFASLTEAARPYRVRPVVEFNVYRPVRTLADAVTIAERSVGGGVLLDSLHIQRCGVSLDEIAGVDPALLSYLQLCDAPLKQPHGLPFPAVMPRGQHVNEGDDAILEARSMRLLPGDGELPLARLLSILPGDLPVSVEAPSLVARSEFTAVEHAAQARRSLDELLS